MKPTLQLKLGQSLTLTPQLQQAIKLLQMSTLDLQQTIQETLDANPLLEREEDYIDGGENQDEDTIEGSVDLVSAIDTNPESELAVDTRWEDLMPSSAPPVSAEFADDGPFGERDALPESLRDHLLWQLNLTRFSDTDRTIALNLIDAIDENGRLTQSPDDILVGLDGDEIEIEEVLAVLHRLQHFEPTGVFAVDLRECLLLQLRQMPVDVPHRELAGALVSRHLDQLTSFNARQLARRLRTDEESIVSARELIRSLDPYPGASIGADDTQYVIPDVFVNRSEGYWRVELNPDIAPKLRINEGYASLSKAGSDQDKSFVKDNLQEARWFMRSLLSRNETLLKVAGKIVELQRGFLEHGDVAMKPLVLSDIAEAVGLHESTVSRATTQKYMHTPRGVYELKYFFSAHVATAEGGECSSTAIKAHIKSLINNEDARKPLSDSKLCNKLEEKGLIVARRTVAKYREQLHIPPSNERKRLV